MTLGAILNATLVLVLIQMLAVGLYVWSYRKAVAGVSRREMLVIAPLVLPLLFILLWLVGLLDYSQTYGLENAIAWQWWQPLTAIVMFGAGHMLAQRLRSILVGKNEE